MRREVGTKQGTVTGRFDGWRSDGGRRRIGAESAGQVAKSEPNRAEVSRWLRGTMAACLVRTRDDQMTF